MQRRTILMGAAGGIVALIGAGAGIWSQIPTIPESPEPHSDTALAWIAYQDGRFTLTLPRVEMGQNIGTALKQVACAELGVDWEEVDLALHATDMPRVKATVGSESVMLFAEPLAQACAALRDAIASGQKTGLVTVIPRPLTELHGLRSGGRIGASPEIAQGRDIVTGAPLYAADVMRPRMQFGRVLRAPASVERASRPLNWDIDAARAVSGFVAVVEDCGPPIGKAHGLGIIASRPGALDDITDALQVQWDIAPFHSRVSFESAIDIDTWLSEGKPSNVVLDGRPVDGPRNVDLYLNLPMAAHASIEARSAVAEWRGGNLSVWAGTQDAFYIRDFLADAFAVPKRAVAVQSCRIGGAFGGKTICTVEAEAAALARDLNEPVKVQWTRAQEYALGFHRPPSSHRIRASLSGGRITDWDHALVSSHILFTPAVVPAWMQRATDAFVGDGGVARGMAAPYVLGRARAAYDMIRLPVHTGPWRGLGAGPNGMAIESAIDEAALSAGVDPLTFRLAHINDPTLAAVLVRVGKIAAWGNRQVVKDGLRSGRGIACGIYKETSYAAAVSDVDVNAKGDVRVTRLWCVHDCGLVINPDQVRAQCEGNLVWGLGMVLFDNLPTESGRVTAENFTDAPIPRLSEVPPITVELIESNRRPSGAGETAIVAGPGAIANAIRAATGQRLRNFPVRREDLAV